MLIPRSSKERIKLYIMHIPNNSKKILSLWLGNRRVKYSRFLLFLSVMLSITLLLIHSSLYAISPELKKYLDGGIMYYQDGGCDTTPGATPAVYGGSLDRFLQVLAYQESRGNPLDKAPGSTATGKYQYIDSTWASRKQLYGPAGQYHSAYQAPEEVQDAVAFIEYTQVLNTYHGDIFKATVNHYLPAANTNPALLDIVPHPEAGNKYTPRQYAEMFMKKLDDGTGKDIPLKYSQAPEFNTWLQKVGGSQTGSLSISASVPSGPSSSGNSITGSSTVIALDPGHGAEVPQYTDPITKLEDRETANSPERENVQDVANQIKAGLEQAGYTVVMLKNNATDAVSKRQRVDAAKNARANLGISIHTDSGKNFDTYGEVWPQFVGGYRQLRSNPGVKTTFTNQDVANKSSFYSDIFATERNASEHGGGTTVKKVVGQSNSFGASRADIPSIGDISLMQLWADDIPWVYNEIGSPTTGLTPDQQNKYATGIINAVKKAIPNSNTTQNSPSDGCNGSLPSAQGGGDVVATALLYAWPDKKPLGFTTLKPEYDTAVKKAIGEGRYVGDRGIDCGGFVTTVIIDSKYDLGYNHGGFTNKGASSTATQLAWARENWQSLGRGNTINTGDLRPGDVAFWVNSDGSNGGHTFMYVGQQANFDSVVASASLGDKAPSAGTESPVKSNVEWYRKK